MIIYNNPIHTKPNKECIMSAINTALFTATEVVGTRDNFGSCLVQTSNGNDYVFNNEQVLIEAKYGAVSLLEILYQTGRSFKGGDYNRPTTKLEIYSDCDRMVRIFDDWADYARDDEESELIDFFNQKMAAAGLEERFTQEDIDYLYNLVRNNEPESPSEEVEDYLYDVDIITWVNSENGSYPESEQHKAGLSYDEMRELQRNYDIEINKVYLAA